MCTFAHFCGLLAHCDWVQKGSRFALLKRDGKKAAGQKMDCNNFLKFEIRLDSQRYAYNSQIRTQN